MSKRSAAILLTAPMLLVMLLATCSIQASAVRPVAVLHARGLAGTDAQINAIVSNITEIDWNVVTGELSSADLAGASLLIMVKVDAFLNYTDAEIAAVKSWFNEGGKVLWVAGDSDFGDDNRRQPDVNRVLEALGSSLRLERCAVDDPVSNAGASYRVLGLSEKCDTEAKALVEGVDKALFHGPACVIGYVDGSYMKLEETCPSNVYRIMWTSSLAQIVNNNPPDPQAHEVGDEGTFVLMALEVDYEKKGGIIVTGDAPFDHYMGLYKPEIHRYQRYAVDYPQQGDILFRNIVTKTSLLVSLQSEKAMLSAEVESLNSQIEGLQSDVSGLEAQVSDLESQVSSLHASVGSWQTYTVVSLIAGLIIGAVLGRAVFGKK